MISVHCRCVCLTMLVVMLAAVASAQITFSRDWVGGKRSDSAPGPPSPPLHCAQFARLCRRFIHDLKLVMDAEYHQHPDEAAESKDKEATTYDDE